MIRGIQKVIEYGIYTFVVLLPWQTRWIVKTGSLGGEHFEYGTLSVYATDIILCILLILTLFIAARAAHMSIKHVWVLIISFFLICFASIFWSINKEVSWYAAVKLAEGIVLFWIVVQSTIRWRLIVAAFVSSAIIQAALGMFQFFSQRIVANKWLGFSDHSPEVLGDFVVEASSGRFLRAYGALPHPNMLAGFLVIALIMCISLLLASKKYRVTARVTTSLLLASIAIMTFGLVLTFSRSAWLIFVLALLVFAAIYIWRRDRFRTRVIMFIIATVIAVTSLSVVLLPEVWQTRITGGRLETMSRVERTDSYGDSLEIISNHWYQGVGIGNYTQALHNSDNSRDVWDYQPVHNIYLLVATEVGVFGLLAFLIVLYRPLSISFYQRRRALAASSFFAGTSFSFAALLLVGLFDHYPWSLSFGVLFFWILLALWVRSYREIAAVDK